MNDETSRLQALLDQDILDTAPEPAFDDIVQLARTICGTPIALVSLVASDRQWFKARVGLEICETPLDQSVCAFALEEEALLVIPDLTLDRRTAANTLVTGEPGIRFYAGAVLRTDEGAALGTLCVIDMAPRPAGLTPEQHEGLLALARQTMAVLAMRKVLKEREADLVRTRVAGREFRSRAMEIAASSLQLRVDGARLRDAQEAGRVGSFEIDVATGVLFPSAEFCRLFGLETVTSLPASDVEAMAVPEDRAVVSNRNTRADGSAPTDVEYRIKRRNDQAVRWIARRAEFSRDARGSPVRMIGVVQDVTERRLADARQSGLLALGDELRAATTVADAVCSAARILGAVLDATRAGYALIDERGGLISVANDWTARGALSIAGRHPLATFGATLGRLRRGDVLAVANVPVAGWLAVDAAGYRAIGVKSFVNAPLVQNGELVGVLFVHDAVARTWTQDEIDFARAVADRAYAAVAQAQAEEQQRLLNHELSHRIKNTLAIVQAIAAQTLRAADGRDDVSAFNQRVMALSRAHDVLLHQNWSSARIREVLDGALDLHGDSRRFALEGPDLTLGPKAALSLAMLLHELATNAAKYGALSVDAGNVAIAWTIAEPGDRAVLKLTWQERGGPRASAPDRRGFGSRLIGLGLCGTGGAELRYAPEGFFASFRAPLALVAAQ